MQKLGLSHEHSQGAEVFVVNGDAHYSKAPAQWACNGARNGARHGHLQLDIFVNAMGTCSTVVAMYSSELRCGMWS